jgi:mono/diheme cytochrome c family protein
VVDKAVQNVIVLTALAAVAWLACGVRAADPPSPADLPFSTTVAPILKQYCIDCHGGSDPEAKLALDKYRESGNVQQDFEVWEKVLRMLTAREMPPADAKQLKPEEVSLLLQGVEAELGRFDCTAPSRAGRVTIRRLNRAEYTNTIRDLVGIDFKPADDFPSDDVGEGFDNIGDVLSIPPLLLEKYLDAAEAIVDKAFADEAVRKRIVLVQSGENIGRTDAARQNLRAFATRAFRRPVSDEEIERLIALVRLARDNGGSEEDALKIGLQAILASPHFLFRVELDPQNAEDGARALSDYEIASRLSYFLWSSMPDEELFNLARDGKLRDKAVLAAQVKRMLGDPKAEALVKNFAGQWLQLRDIADATPAPERFPQFDEPLRAAMQRETELFFETIIREDRSILEFLNADFTFVNERLAKHYGIEGVRGGEFRRVSLPAGRRGVLTHASILVITSNPSRTSPVKRGKWIMENILGTPPPPPPPGVPLLDENAETLGSLRERMEQHRADETCAVCHRQMDTLGFGLENFDAIGAWRERDGRFEIDPSGSLPGGIEFDTAGEMMQALAGAKKDDFCRCLASKLFTYAVGRGLETEDRCAVNAVIEHAAENDYRFGALVAAIVTSRPFLMQDLPGGD